MTDQTRIRVLIVDDHAVVRSGLSLFLQVTPDLELVGEAENGDQAIVRCGLLKPDVILMDLMMPGTDGLAATSQIHRLYPNVRIIALTSFHEDTRVQAALHAGAIGYLMKTVSARELAEAIRSAHAGNMTLSPEAGRALAQASGQAAGPSLSDREREVLKLMVDGLNNAEIADRLIISQSTVKYHIGNLFGKLQVDNRVAAVALALQKKLV
ncbi:MAG: response regulator transcription factor [Thermoflexales bacterium]|nr:response regulator transcription factor [Thermoflexales bacterium]